MPAIAIQMLLHKIRPSVVSKNAAQPVNRPRYNLKFPKKYDFYFLTIYDLKRYRCVNFFFSEENNKFFSNFSIDDK